MDSNWYNSSSLLQLAFAEHVIFFYFFWKRHSVVSNYSFSNEITSSLAQWLLKLRPVSKLERKTKMQFPRNVL